MQFSLWISDVLCTKPGLLSLYMNWQNDFTCEFWVSEVLAGWLSSFFSPSSSRSAIVPLFSGCVSMSFLDTEDPINNKPIKILFKFFFLI